MTLRHFAGTVCLAPVRFRVAGAGAAAREPSPPTRRCPLSSLSIPTWTAEAPYSWGSVRLAGGMLHQFTPQFAAGFSASYEYQDWTFTDPVAFGGVAPWNNINRPRLAATMFYTPARRLGDRIDSVGGLVLRERRVDERCARIRRRRDRGESVFAAPDAGTGRGGVSPDLRDQGLSVPGDRLADRRSLEAHESVRGRTRGRRRPGTELCLQRPLGNRRGGSYRSYCLSPEPGRPGRQRHRGEQFRARVSAPFLPRREETSGSISMPRH